MSRSQELSATEKLARRQERTNDDGTVDVEVIDWQEENGTVTIEFYTPVNDKRQDSMSFPKAGGDLDEYTFYRILQSHDLDVRNAELLSGKMIQARVNGDDWTIECERQKPRTTVVREQLSSVDVAQLLIASTWIAVMIIFALVVILV